MSRNTNNPHKHKYEPDILFRILSSRAAWHTAQGVQQEITKQSLQGSSAKPYLLRRAVRLSTIGIQPKGFCPDMRKATQASS